MKEYIEQGCDLDALKPKQTAVKFFVTKSHSHKDTITVKKVPSKGNITKLTLKYINIIH